MKILPISMQDEPITEEDQRNLGLLIRTLLREKQGKMNNRFITHMHHNPEKNHYEIQFSKALFETMILTTMIVKSLDE